MDNRSQDPRRLFAAKVERLSGDRGLSTEALATRANLDPAELEAILGGEDEIALDAIFLLAGALGVSPGELLEGVSWVPDGEGGGDYRSDEPRAT